MVIGKPDCVSKSGDESCGGLLDEELKRYTDGIERDDVIIRTFPASEVIMSRYALILLSSLCLFVTVKAAVMAEVPLAAKQAAAKVGQKVILEVVVQSAGQNGEFLELYSEKDWKAENSFFLRFSGPARERFAGINVSDVAAYLMDETIRVNGEVKELNIGDVTKPVIYVDDVEQIEVIAKKREYTATEKYQKKVLASFTVLIHPDVMKKKKQATECLAFIEQQLKALNTNLPQDKLQVLHKVQLWIGLEDRKNTSIAFHPSAIWLKKNGFNPDMAGGVEIPNVLGYLLWSRTNKVSGIMHEMSHAFHHLHLGEKNDQIKAAYLHAKEQKLYDSVSFVQDGRIQKEPRRAYGMTNEYEYFAEISEAYWGRNDFFPFTREQLKAHDSMGYALINEMWQAPLAK